MRKTIVTSEVIVLGRQGEDGANKVLFPVRGWKELYGEGQFVVTALRPDENDPYPVTTHIYEEDDPYPVVSRHGVFVEWIVGSADVEIPGRGKVELAYYTSDDVRVKSVVYHTVIYDALGQNSLTPPEPWESWVDDVREAGAAAVSSKDIAVTAAQAAEDARDAAQAAAGDFQGITATASTRDPGQAATVAVTHGAGGLYNFAFGIPKGAKGDNAPADLVASAVDDWLDDNYSNPDSPPLDRTLLSGSSATPADISGKIKSDTEIGYYSLNANDFEAGNYDADGTKVVGTRVIRIKQGIPLRSGDKISFSTGTLYINVFALDAYGVNIYKCPSTDDYWSLYATPQTYTATENCTVYLTFRNNHVWNTSTDIDPTDYNGTITIENTIGLKAYNMVEPIDKWIYRKCGDDSWAVGTIYNGNYDPTNNKRIADLTYIRVAPGAVIKSLYRSFTFGIYDADKNYLEGVDWQTDEYEITTAGAAFVRIALRYDNATVMTDTDIALYKNTVMILYAGKAVESVLGGNGINSATIREKTFNSSYHTGAEDFETKVSQFCSLFYGDTIVADKDAPTDFESFLFFTDPHTMMSSGWESRNMELITQIQKYYNSTPTTFCLCGGDWLGNSDLPATACYKMGYIDGFMNSKFKDGYMLVGNHDTNYQGKADAESATGTTRLSNQSIADLWYRKGKAYFTIEGASTIFYCFDTGIEAQALTDLDGYGYTQCKWFANALLEETHDHIAIAMHILYNQSPSHGVKHYLAAKVFDIAKAYNDRSAIVVDDTTYNFSSATGKVEFCIAGHSHQDANGAINGIPYVLSINAGKENDVASFDLIMVDYDNGVINCVRVGYGDDRVISLTDGTLIS